MKSFKKAWAFGWIIYEDLIHFELKNLSTFPISKILRFRLFKIFGSSSAPPTQPGFFSLCSLFQWEDLLQTMTGTCNKKEVKRLAKPVETSFLTKFFRGSENISPGIFEYYLNNKTHFVLGKKSVENFPRNFFSKSPRVTLLVSPDWRLDNDSKQEFFLLKKDFLPVPIAECVLVLLPPCCCRILLRADGDKSIMKFDRMISLDFEDPTTLDPCALKERSDIWWKKHQKQTFHQKECFSPRKPFLETLL